MWQSIMSMLGSSGSGGGSDKIYSNQLPTSDIVSMIGGEPGPTASSRMGQQSPNAGGAGTLDVRGLINSLMASRKDQQDGNLLRRTAKGQGGLDFSSLISSFQ